MKKNTKSWKEWGKYYGYPECCIEYFCTDITYKDVPYEVHKGHGFLPCPDCTKKIREGKTTLEQLITNRQCPTSFPVQS